MIIFIPTNSQDFVIKNMAKLHATFISFAIAEGRIYAHKGNTYLLPPVANQWRGKNVFGSLFHIRYDFNVRLLDAYNMCTKSTLTINHKSDINHRVEIDVTPIHFNEIDDFCRHRYEFGNSLKAETYFANEEHPYFATLTLPHKRVVDGLDKCAFVNVFKHVTAK